MSITLALLAVCEQDSSMHGITYVLRHVRDIHMSMCVLIMYGLSTRTNARFERNTTREPRRSNLTRANARYERTIPSLALTDCSITTFDTITTTMTQIRHCRSLTNGREPSASQFVKWHRLPQLKFDKCHACRYTSRILLLISVCKDRDKKT
jgi:hypothetical protein